MFLLGKIIYAFQLMVAKLFVRPKKNRIAFTSLKDYSDNARALSDYLINQENNKYEIYWFVSDKKQCEEQYKDLSIKFYNKEKRHHHYEWKTVFAAFSCELICYTHDFIINRNYLNKNQIWINLWHGCGYKDSEKQNSKRQFDFVLVPGDVFVNTKQRFFCVTKEKIWPIGYPRYDSMLKPSVQAEKFIKSLIEESKRIVIWMPTFRNTGLNIFPEEQCVRRFELPVLLNFEEMKILDAYCKSNDILVCIKRHPMQLIYECENYNLKNIKFIDDKILKDANVQLYSLLQYTDALISDYSSISVDYMLLNKPIAYALDDYEQYKEARGFVFENPLDYMPGHHLYNIQDLLDFLNDISNNVDKYVNERERVMKHFHNQSDNYCKTVWDKIESIR